MREKLDVGTSLKSTQNLYAALESNELIELFRVVALESIEFFFAPREPQKLVGPQEAH